MNNFEKGSYRTLKLMNVEKNHSKPNFKIYSKAPMILLSRNILMIFDKFEI